MTGRFAPSPTGPLHLGSLRTALIEWLFARSQAVRFVVRVRTLIASARGRSSGVASSPTCVPSGSTGTGRWSANPSAPTGPDWPSAPVGHARGAI